MKEINYNTAELLNALSFAYETEGNWEPCAYINGMKLTKAQLTELLSVLDTQASTDRETAGVYQGYNIHYAIDDDNDVTVLDGALFDRNSFNAYMTAKGWSIRELAKRSELSYPTVYNAMTGKAYPSANATKAMAIALGIANEN